MEDYSFSENSNDNSGSKEFPANVSLAEHYTPTSTTTSNTVSNYQNKTLTLQDDVLSDKLPSLTQTVDTNEEQVSQSEDDSVSAINVGNGVVSDIADTERLDPCSAVSSVHLSAYNASEPSLNVINSNASSNLWSNSVDDHISYSLNNSVNGALTFPNYVNPDNALYEANIINQTPNLSSQIPRRSYTAGNFSNLAGSVPQPNNQQNIFIQNKAYTGNWSNARNVWPASVNNQNNINNLSNWRGRSVPNLNPMHNLTGRKLNNPHFMQQHSSMIMPAKFRRSTSFPGKPIFNQANCYDISNVDDNAELLLQHYQDPAVLNNGNNFGPSPLDTMNTLQHYLNDVIRPPVDVTDAAVAASGNNNIVGNGNIVAAGTNGGGADIVGKNSGYMNVNLMQSFNQMSERTPYFTGFDEQVANSIIDNPGAASHMVDGGQVYLQSLNHQASPLNLSDKEEKFSRKVFVGGLPPDIDEEEISTSFRRFGPLVVDWPHKAESKSYFPPKGYAFLLFQDEMSVQQLIDACIQEEDKLYLVVSSPTVKDKAVQIRPWKLTDADFVLNASMPLDPRKTVFVGGVPRPLKAFELATIMDRLYGCVCYAGIDTDPELKYPKGAGRVAFSSQHSYISAISARFVQLQHGEIDKRVEVKPYVLDDQMCDECNGQCCGGKFAPFFCANVMCLQYYCEHCWNRIHSRSGREYHKPLVKEGADRPRALQQQQYRWC